MIYNRLQIKFICIKFRHINRNTAMWGRIKKIIFAQI